MRGVGTTEDKIAEDLMVFNGSLEAQLGSLLPRSIELLHFSDFPQTQLQK